ncbi:MAG: metallo-mystery pair system four-Cys motif protein [Bryobacterales bacterium]|nr:metallo-mystery pair system four-Cys motif protein [Bryobacterales bacterium]
MRCLLLAGTLAALPVAHTLSAQTHPVTIRFGGAVNGEPLHCGTQYAGVGASDSQITPIDFRFYVHDIRLVDARGDEHRVDLEQNAKWQIERIVLLDFEDASGSCSNGTPETNFEARGTVDSPGPWHGVRFYLGVPFNRNHTDPTRMPAPLNLTALAWPWNAGRKFARLDFSSSGLERGFAVHLGSTGCTPNDTKVTAPTSCASPNRPEVELLGFDPASDTVIADLGWLLKGSNLDENAPDTASGCMSSPMDPDCAPLFANLGLAFKDQPARGQRFFRLVRGSAPIVPSGASAE